jgi:hypothetical protein
MEAKDRLGVYVNNVLRRILEPQTTDSGKGMKKIM